MEVMGLMLGEFIDDYTVRVIDVFAMPQSGTVWRVFGAARAATCAGRERGGSGPCVPDQDARPPQGHQQVTHRRDARAMTRRRHEMVVGWYHSHPGFGCWLSNVDCNTQQARACDLSAQLMWCAEL